MAHTEIVEVGSRRAPEHDRHPSMAAGAVAVINGPKPHYELIKNLLSDRIQPDYDVSPHVHRVALPAPGGDAELFGAIAHALERPLDLGRPLWECWVIERLKGNRWAILMKVHDTIAHHAPPARLLARLCDDAGPEAFANRAVAEPVSRSNSETSSWSDALWQLPVDVFKAAAGAAAAVLSWSAPAGSTNTLRHYRTLRFPRASVEDVARKVGVSANDVALAAITEGFRTLLTQRGEQPRPDSLRVAGPLLPHLPVEHEDPVRQLRAVHSGMGRKALPSPAYSPLALCARAFQMLSGLPRAGEVSLAATAPGPRKHLRVMGQRLDDMLPIPPTAEELNTGVAVLTYADELVLGITAGYDAVTDLEQLTAGIEHGMTRLLALNQDSVLLFDRRRKRPRRPVAYGAARWRPVTPPVRVRRH